MDTLFLDYEYTLIGRLNDVGAYNFYGTDPGGANQSKALSCIRYAIEKVLCWTQDEAFLKFDQYIIEQMKLSKIIKMIRFPDEVDDGDPRYILSLLYPQRLKLSAKQLVDETFERVLATGCQFPREYFVGVIGFQRYCQCFKRMVEEYVPFKSIPEMYRFFASPKGNDVLLQYRLKIPGDYLGFDIYDCIHFISPEPGADFYYYFYCFRRKLLKYRKQLALKKKQL